MTYQIKMLRGAQKQLEQLPKADYKAVKAKIDVLANNPRPFGCEKLKDRDGYRIRQGDFRIIYDIYDKLPRFSQLTRPQNPENHLILKIMIQTFFNPDSDIVL